MYDKESHTSKFFLKCFHLKDWIKGYVGGKYSLKHKNNDTTGLTHKCPGALISIL